MHGIVECLNCAQNRNNERKHQQDVFLPNSDEIFEKMRNNTEKYTEWNDDFT